MNYARNIIRKTLLVLFFTLFSFSVHSQNAAYIYRDSILNIVPNYKENIKLVDSLNKTYSKELNSLEKNLSERSVKLLKPYNIKENEDLEAVKKKLKPTDIEQLNLLLKEQELISKQKTVYYDLYTATYNKKIQPLLDDVNSLIDHYAKDNKIDIVWIMEENFGKMAYINKEKNITSKIIATIRNRK